MRVAENGIYRLRLWYMTRNELVKIIKVNENNTKVKILTGSSRNVTEYVYNLDRLLFKPLKNGIYCKRDIYVRPRRSIKNS